MGANAQTTVPTFVASQVLTADQMNQSARTGVPVFADSTARDAAFGGSGEKTLAEGQLCYLESTNVVQYYDGSVWATVGPGTAITADTATVATAQTTTSGTFTDLATVGPSVTMTTGTKVLVLCNSKLSTGNANEAYFDFAISGATTRAAAFATDSYLRVQSSDSQGRFGVSNLMTVTAGSNTFTMKYASGGGIVTFTDRTIIVVAL